MEIALLNGLAKETALRTLSKLRILGTVVDDDCRLCVAALTPLQALGLLISR